MSNVDSGSLMIELREAESGELERLVQEHLERSGRYCAIRL
jgi:hypothetical protein